MRAYLDEAERLGVREYYFTGGEPFLNREILEILEAALAQGPVTVLTNGLLIRPETAARLRALSDALALQPRPARLDRRLRTRPPTIPSAGAGTFDRILAGDRRSWRRAGLNPVVTVTEACEGARSAEGRARLLAFLRGTAACAQPRLKVMPLLRLGAEAAALARLRGVGVAARAHADARRRPRPCSARRAGW